MSVVNMADYKNESESPDNPITKEKLDPSDHYFKVDRKILNIASSKDLGKAELLLYLQHCRAANPKKNLGCSLVGIKNTAKKNLGLDPLKIEKTQKLLIDKYLLRERPDVKNGFLKSVPIEVLAFPDYTPPKDNKSQGLFKPNGNNENQHRTYEKGTYINLPSALIDSGVLKDLRRQSLFALILLYDNINWLDSWGVNLHLLYKKDSVFVDGYRHSGRFGEGFRLSIFQKNYAEVTNPTTWHISNDLTFIQGNLKDALDEIIEKKLFNLKPVLVEKDLDDPEILRFKKEIFKGIFPFSTQKENPQFLLHEPDQSNQKIFWILVPADEFIIKTPEYAEFHKNQQESYSSQKEFYEYNDFRTRKSDHIKLINTEDFWDWLVNAYNDTYEEISSIMGKSPESVYEKNKIYKDEYLKEDILPHIPIDQIVHYNNSINYSKFSDIY